MPARVASLLSPRQDSRSAPTRRRGTAALALGIGLILLAGTGCAQGDASEASADASNTSPAEAATAATNATNATEPPPGSGATAPGITQTTPPPIVPSGSTKANIACRQMFPVVNDAITAWNSANNRDNRSELQSASQGLSRAAEAIPAMATSSEDSRLVSLTGSVSTQLSKVATDYAADRDVVPGPLQQATSALWTYCESTH